MKFVMMGQSFNMMKSIALFVADSNGCYPVPASKGGAVSTLVELLVEGNNRKQLVDMTLVSYFDKKLLSYLRSILMFISFG